jgi:hypothetical protein
MKKKARVIAFYLPQFHPIPENDKWWGKGFTEWTNVAKAKPLFKGHYQPHIPTDLGFYDLRLPVIREQQAEMAREAGIEGFCYWHYWMGGGRMLLERPFKEVLDSGKPDYPFCLAWANGPWSNRSWSVGSFMKKDSILMDQTYGHDDYIQHFNYVLKAFKDPRYIKVDGKPLFYIHDPLLMPVQELKDFIVTWRKLAEENGLKGIYFVGRSLNIAFREIGKSGEGKLVLPNKNNAHDMYQYTLDCGFDAVNSRGSARAAYELGSAVGEFTRKMYYKIFKVGLLKKYKQIDINKHLYVDEDKWENVHPTIIPCYDRSPREGKMAVIYTDSTPEVFEKQIIEALDLIKDKQDEHKILFLQSWNEWAEGNHMEPDMKYGHGYLDALKRAIEL